MTRTDATRGLLVVVTAALVPLLTGCTGKLDRSDELITVLDRTAALSRQFTYTEMHAGHTTKVTGVVADDLRYSIDLSVDGKPGMSEVMRDDSRALRVDPTYVTKALAAAHSGGAYGNTPINVGTNATGATPAASPSASASAAPEPLGVTVTKYANTPPAPATLTALGDGKWVVDPTGAGPIGRLQSDGKIQELGTDPVLDALTLFKRIHDTVRAGAPVEIYNPEAIDYRKDLDPFDAPPAGEVRYDIHPGGLPPRASTVGTSPQQRELAVPGEPYFGALSVYVKGGVAVRIAESVDVKRRLVADPEQDVLARLADAGLTVPDAVLQGDATKQAGFIEKALNALLSRRGAPQLRERDVEYDISNLGGASDVEVPTDAVTGNLAGVLVRGQVLAEGQQ